MIAGFAAVRMTGILSGVASAAPCSALLVREASVLCMALEMWLSAKHPAHKKHVPKTMDAVAVVAALRAALPEDYRAASADVILDTLRPKCAANAAALIGACNALSNDSVAGAVCCACLCLAVLLRRRSHDDPVAASAYASHSRRRRRDQWGRRGSDVSSCKLAKCGLSSTWTGWLLRLSRRRRKWTPRGSLEQQLAHRQRPARRRRC